MKLYKLLFSFVLLLFSFLLFVPPAHAANFTTDYHIVYSPTDSGVTHAMLNVTLTNTTTQFYASEYKIQLGFDNVYNVQAVDIGGQLAPVVSKTADGYTIDLHFNAKAVGNGNQLTFTVAFDTNSVAKKRGTTWEINIPGISNPNDFSNFVVEVKPPPSYGKPVYIKPKQEYDNLVFTKDQLGRSGISVAFGQSEVYTFHLNYNIANKNVYPSGQDIALPSNTNYQDVSITSINPRPQNVTVDHDGNWIAHYNLYPSQTMNVDVIGKAKVYLTPQQVDLSDEDAALYTKPQQYWEADNDQIHETADDLKTAQNIYNYVVHSLKYDFNTVTSDQPRLGALGTMQRPYASACREFTDMFIALARAEGIPAREVDGYAYTENPKQHPLSLEKDILHAWPEFYDSDKKAWVMVDPTWGNTTGGVDYFNVLDFDHLAFVVKGSSSTAPLAAGAYKVGSKPGQKDVTVSFADSFDNAAPTVTVNSVFDRAIGGFPLNGVITLTNTGSLLIPEQTITAESGTLTPQSQTLQAGAIPPFGTVSIPVKFDPVSFLTNQNAAFTIRVGGGIYPQTIKITPFYMNIWVIGGIILGILTLGLLITAYKIRRIRVSRHR